MKITWLGHASFLIESNEGTRVVTDPFESGSYDGAVGYTPIECSADAVTVSHDHADHNAVECVTGDPEVVRGTEPVTVKEIAIRGVGTYHDENKGKDRGRNTVYVMDIEGMRVAHLGDLGHVLTDEERDELGQVDVVFAPVGGYYTIGPEEAKRVAEQLGAKIIVPMHYKTDALGFPIQPVDEFLKLMQTVERANGTSFEVMRSDLPENTKVVVLDYE